MPGNITQFTSPIDKLAPNEGAEHAYFESARSEQRNIDQAGEIYGHILKSAGNDVENYEYSQEVSQGAAALAVMHNNMVTSWNKTTAATDVNDSTIQQKFMDDANQQLSDWQDGFQTKRGQEWALSQADSIKNHMWEKTSADMGVRAGDAAVSNLTTQVRNLADTAGKDFTTMDSALNQVDAMVAAQGESGYFNSKMQDAISSDMKNELVKASLKGLADNNPQKALAVISSGQFSDYMSPGEQKELQGYATVQAHGQIINQQRQQQAKQYEQQQRTSQVNAQYVSDVTEGKTPSAINIIADKNLTLDQKTAWIAKDGILSKPESFLRSPTYGTNFGQSAQAIYNGKPPSDDDILKAIRVGDITPNGAKQLQQLAAMAKTPQGVIELNTQKPVLTYGHNEIVKGGSYAADPVGEQYYNQYMHAFYNAWDNGIKKGITPAQMADPESKEYLGSLAQQFKRSDAQALYDVTQVR